MLRHHLTHMCCKLLQSKRGKQAPFQSRIQMCQLLFKDIPNVIVSEAERICFERVSDGL